MRSILLIILFSTTCCKIVFPQETSDPINDEIGFPDETITGTFKGSRIINAHSVELRKRGEYELLISHRFGSIDGGPYDLFGLDRASVRIGIDYPLTDKFTLGAGRSSFEKRYDMFGKLRLLIQSSGTGAPFSAVVYQSVSIGTLKTIISNEIPTIARLSYVTSGLIARKLSPAVSAQFSPTWVHHNFRENQERPHDVFLIGIAARAKISPRIAITFEHFVQAGKSARDSSNDAFGLGIDIETGGHVFQLHFTNSQATTDAAFLTETNRNFFDGAIHFGFNVTRAFYTKK